MTIAPIVLGQSIIAQLQAMRVEALKVAGIEEDLDDKASQAALDALAGTVAGKASNGALTTVAGNVTALAAIVNLLEPVYAEYANDARARPGDSPLSFMSALGEGMPSGLDPITIGAPFSIAEGEEGQVLRVAGGVDARIVYAKRIFAVESWESYGARWTPRRTKNSGDPSGDTVECGLVWLGRRKEVLGELIVDARAPTIYTGTYYVKASFSRNMEADYQPPNGTRYALPFIRIHGTGNETDIITLDIYRSSGLAGPAGPEGDVTPEAIAAALDAADAAEATKTDRSAVADLTATAIAAFNSSGNFYSTLALANAAIGSIGLNKSATVTADPVSDNNGLWVNENNGLPLVQRAKYDPKNLDTLQELTDRNLFMVADEVGMRALRVSETNVEVAGWTNMRTVFDGPILRVGTEDGHVFMEVDPIKGIELPTAYLRPISDALFRIGTEDWSFFEISPEGQVSFGGSSTISITRDSQIAQIMSGAPTDTTMDVIVDIDGGPAAVAQLIVSTDEYLTNRVYESEASMPMVTGKSSVLEYKTARFRATDLARYTRHYAQVAIDGLLPTTPPITFMTFPEEGVPAAYRFLAASCSRLTLGERLGALDAMAASAGDPLFTLHMGDLAYADISVNDIYRFRSEIMRKFRAHTSGKFLTQRMPLIWINDDHDKAGPLDAVYESLVPGSDYPTAMATFRQTYRETALPYPFTQQMQGETDPDKILLMQQWTVATTRFIMPDCHSQRTRLGAPTMLGTGANPAGSWDQLSALKAALVQAGTDGMDNVILIVGPTWPESTISGSWGFWFQDEKEEIERYLRDTPGIPYTLIFCGDAHATMISDGTDTATVGLTVPVICSSAIASASTGSGIGAVTWNGVPGLFNAAKEYYVAVDHHVSGGALSEVSFKVIGGPWNVSTFEGTVLGEFSTLDKTRTIQFTSAAQNVAASSTADIVVDKSWFGPGNVSATWTAQGGQTGTVTFRPNQGRQTITVNTPASGTRTVTLSAPSANATLGAVTVITLTVV